MTDVGLEILRALQANEQLREAPNEGLAVAVRGQFPTEDEFADMLDRRMRRRRMPRRPTPSLDEVERCLRSFLKVQLEGPFDVRDVRWLSGGASKIQVAFTLLSSALAHEQEGSVDLVIRMEPQESLNSTSRRREFQLIEAVRETVPVPRPYWIDVDADWFPEPTLIYELVRGTNKVSTIEGRPTGTGNSFGSRLRPALGRRFVEDLAKIHTLDFSGADLGAFDLPRVGTTDTALWQLNRARRIWEEDRPEDFPLIDVAANWLHRNLPVLDHVSLLHGDFRGGNFLFDEESGEITAWLDWERGHLGDRHRDLAWITSPTFGHYDDDGTTFLVSGLVPLEEFYERYEKLSGLFVDPERLRFYRVLNNYQLVISTLGTAYRVTRLGRTHQDVLLTWLEGVVYSMAEQLRTAMEEDRHG